MKIDNIKVAIFHRKDTTEIQADIHSENSYNLGKKEIDDNFRIEFDSDRNQNFLIFHNKDGHYEHIEAVSTEISIHRKINLVIIKDSGIALEYKLGIRHENHHSFLFFEIIREMKFFMHSNGLPDSHQIDRKKHQVFLNIIFSRMDDSQLIKIG